MSNSEAYQFESLQTEPQAYIETSTVFAESIPFAKALEHYTADGDFWAQTSYLKNHDNQWRNYNNLTAVAANESGDLCVIRSEVKNLRNYNFENAVNWLVVIYDAKSRIWEEFTPIGIEVESEEDLIDLQIPTQGGPLKANQGPDHLRFNMSSVEMATENRVEMGHVKIYGGNLHFQIDSEFNTPVNYAQSEQLADVIDFEAEKLKRRQQEDAYSIGHDAVAGS